VPLAGHLHKLFALEPLAQLATCSVLSHRHRRQLRGRWAMRLEHAQLLQPLAQIAHERVVVAEARAGPSIAALDTSALPGGLTPPLYLRIPAAALLQQLQLPTVAKYMHEQSLWYTYGGGGGGQHRGRGG
jgi:hypothetical protein